MSPQEIGEIALAFCAVSLQCLCPLLLGGGAIWFIVKYNRRKFESIAFSPPSEFKPRCPMCGNRRIQWGTHYSKNEFYVPRRESDPVGYVRRKNSIGNVMSKSSNIYMRRAAARCMNCGYIMTFFPPE